MYSDELEALINAALADGTITDKEKLILKKRAAADGIDADEFELVLNARIIMANRAHSQAQPSAPKSNKLGELRKCPSCGSLIGSFQMICPDCGYEFSGVGPNSFVQKFTDGLRQVTTEASRSVKLSGCMKFFDYYGSEEDKRKDMAICKAESLYVKTYPLPLTKEDSIEMLQFMVPKIKASGANGATLTWRRKYDAILSKLESQVSGDPSLQSLASNYRAQSNLGFFGKINVWWKSLSRIVRVSIILALFYVAFFGLIGGLLSTYA